MDYLDISLKIILAILALFGIQNVVNKVSVKFKKQSNTLSLQKSSEENIGRDKIIITTHNYYGIPTVSKREDALNTPPKELKQVEPISEIELDAQQVSLVIMINRVHKIYDQPYDFTDDYKFFVFHERNKRSKDWYVTAAVYIVNSIQNIGVKKLFDCFEPEAEEIKNIILQSYKEKITASYGELQKIRHVDKRGSLVDNHLTPYERKVLELKEPPISRIEDIFKKFQEDLNYIFTNYKLKEQI